MVEWLKRIWAVISYDERQVIIDRIRARGARTVTIVPTLKVEVVSAEGEVMDKPVLTDSQEINGTFWDNMEAAGIDFDDRVKVLESLRAALNEHCGTLYIP